MVKKMFIAGVVILSLFGLSPVAKADTRDVTFHLDNSLDGSTFFHQNVTVSNLFDAVPFYNILQQWRGLQQGDKGLNSFYKGELFN